MSPAGLVRGELDRDVFKFNNILRLYTASSNMVWKLMATCKIDRKTAEPNRESKYPLIPSIENMKLFPSKKIIRLYSQKCRKESIVKSGSLLIKLK